MGEREARVLSCVPTVRYLAGRAWERAHRIPELDDLVGAGFVGLCEAAKRYRKKRGVRFSAFAFHRIEGAILDELRHQRLHLPLPEDWDPEDPSALDPAALAEERDLADRLLETLKKKDMRVAFILRRWLLEGETQKDIAKKLKIPKSRVSSLARKGIRYLKARYNRRRKCRDR